MALGVAFIGLDHWYTAFMYLGEAAASPDIDLVGIAETDTTRYAEIETRYPGVPIAGDADALLARDDVDLVAIAASTDRAPALARRALEAGKHVVSVKPPARTLEELDGVLAAARAGGRFYASFECLMRLTPRLQSLRRLIADGAVGRPLAYYQLGHGGLPSPWPGQQGPSWWTDAARVPGGAWIDHAIYSVDLARFVFDGEIDHVSGIVENRTHIDLSVEDYGIALMRLRPRSGGASVSLVLEDTWSSDPGKGMHYQEIVGTSGTLRLSGKEWVVSQGSEQTRHPLPDAEEGALPALARMLASGETPPFGPDDARANLAACLEFYRAAAR